VAYEVGELQAKCQKLGFEAGISGAIIQQLITEFGPVLAQYLIQLLGQKKAAEADKLNKLDPTGASWLKQLFLNLLTTDSAQITTWLQNGETAAFQAFVNAAGNSNPVLAAILALVGTKLAAAEVVFNADALQALQDAVNSMS
jgi:hypothetical protein